MFGPHLVGRDSDDESILPGFTPAKSMFGSSVAGSPIQSPGQHTPAGKAGEGQQSTPSAKVNPGVQESRPATGAETGGHHAVPTSAQPEAPAVKAPEPLAPVAPAPVAPAPEALAPEAPGPVAPRAPAAPLAGGGAKSPGVMRRPAARPAARPASISGPTVEELRHIARTEKRISRKVEKQDDHKAPGAASKAKAKAKKKWESGASLRRKREREREREKDKQATEREGWKREAVEGVREGGERRRRNTRISSKRSR